MSDFEVSFGLEGRVIAVTGAAQGIGQGVAVAAAGAGADVALIDLDEDRLAETKALVEATGRRAQAVGVDIGDRDAVLAAFARIDGDLGAPHGLVNCAAIICENLPAEEAAEADMDRLWRVNVKGSLWAAQAAFAGMKAAGGGSIVNLASQAAILSLPNQVVYTATKGAIAAMTRSQAIDWAPHGIRVNAIAPTFVWTPMAAPMLEIQQVHDASVKRIPLGRIGQPKDIAGAAVFLCTDAASMITGHLLPVDGGWTAGEPGLDL
ncbi:glucose 1-dehydrogenase [Baekduia soli]|uniref:Glucose 1-dehydrogenase n=1 Tax=Baekduia soli TaxID=496014 RepID=A0A5B8U662_9ACTN|nr:glucose 1-dehydrogenase [Baekduia soli]QEC48421.1 glucose 1-dehydrogenase [Baekduia soli]